VLARQQFGPAQWCHVEERLPSLPDTLLFYFVAFADARAFVDRASCAVCGSRASGYGGVARTVGAI